MDKALFEQGKKRLDKALRTRAVTKPKGGLNTYGTAVLINIVWIYGALARDGSSKGQESFAHCQIVMSEGSTIADLLRRLRLPAGERGITFINGQLSAMPGLQPGLRHVLHDGDRVGLFDKKSMWPFQYRHGVALTEEMKQAMAQGGSFGLRHSYEK